jgi:3-deoxy-manno-octulosonate cytidylyltransferase (CMP-KDO synthetase)
VSDLSFICVIPARLQSTRLPNKPLADIHGKPMVVHVAARAALSGAQHVYVATDDASVMAACAAHGVAALLTKVEHATGTDRLAEVVAQLQLPDDAIVVNVQGDEPLIDPLLIRGVAGLLGAKTNANAAIATASQRITLAEDFFNPNVVKVVTDADQLARYFSRAPIPYARDAFAIDKTTLPADLNAQRHIGIYGYRAHFLRRFQSLAIAPSEQLEALEQLRALHHGYDIAVLRWQGEIEAGVDTPTDLERLRALPAKRFG